MASERHHPVDPLRHHRENGWDYRGRAIYHFTLPVEGRYPLFGTLEGESAETAFVMLNTFGRRVYQMIDGLAEFYAARGFALKVLAQKVMPDHVHLVIQVLEPLPQSIGAVVRGFKSGCTKVYKEMFVGGGGWATRGGSGGENAAGMHANSGATAAAELHANSGENATEMHGGGGENAAGMHANSGAAAAAEMHANSGAADPEPLAATDTPVHFARIFASRGSIWQQDPAHYHERILHAPGQLRRMIDYVKDNPRRLWLKTHNPDLFKLHRHTEVAALPFTSLGNHFLLDWPDRQMVEMSRSATPQEVQERLLSVLAAAHEGTVTYTAAISEGEKLIARTLREQGFPLVVLLNDGFPKEGSPHEHYYKPGGVYFEACAKGQLLLLEPTEQAFLDPAIQSAVEATLRHKAAERHYAYSPIPVTSQRYRFVALNEMARRLIDN